MFDLNTLISAGPPLFLLRQPRSILGEDRGSRVPKTPADIYAFLAIPSRERDIAWKRPTTSEELFARGIDSGRMTATRQRFDSQRIAPKKIVFKQMDSLT
jgi:hypothetical protein